jgi:hypothetical protein
MADPVLIWIRLNIVRRPETVVKVFLGSSTEALTALDRIREWLESAGHTALPWNAPDLFLPGDNTFLRLIEIARQVQAAIFVFAEDDQVWYRSDALLQPRDNVLLEYGLFAGTLGQNRVSICRTGSPKNPSDLAGLVTLSLKAGRDTASRKKLGAWLQKLETRQPVSNGPDISGLWASHDSLEVLSPAVGSASIVQEEAVVMMSLHRIRSRDGSPTDRTFEYRGRFSSGHLTLLFEDQRGKGFITGAIVLHLSSTLRELVGKTMYFDQTRNMVVSHDFALRRTDVTHPVILDNA